MITLKERIVRLVEAGMENVPGDIRGDIYALSFYFWFLDNETSRPCLSVSYNTMSRVRASTMGEGLKPRHGTTTSEAEAKWNFAFWLQEAGRICEFGQDPLDLSIVRDWLQQLGCVTTPDMPEEDIEKVSQTVYESFTRLCAGCALAIHGRGGMRAVCGREIPIIVHHLEYARDEVRLTRSANDPDLVSEFIAWVGHGRAMESVDMAIQPPAISEGDYAVASRFRLFSKLSYGLWCGIHGHLEEREGIAWAFHEVGNPAGTVMLADFLISFRHSVLRRTDNAPALGRELLTIGFPSLAAKDGKDDWDWYWLGICHGYARGTHADPKQAARCFCAAREMGNEFAEYEEIWFGYLAGGSELEAVLRFRVLGGPLERFANASAGFLALVCAGPSAEAGSQAHAFRILELAKFLHIELAHDIARRKVVTLMQAEMARDVEALEQSSEPTAALVLFLIAIRARRNPTGSAPEHWLRIAAVPENDLLTVLIEQGLIDRKEIQLVSDTCQANGWIGTRLQAAAQNRLLRADQEGR